MSTRNYRMQKKMPFFSGMHKDLVRAFRHDLDDVLFLQDKLLVIRQTRRRILFTFCYSAFHWSVQQIWQRLNHRNIQVTLYMK